jgi:Fe-S-cluster containining protein
MPTKKITKKTSVSANKIQAIPAVFKDNYQKNGRIYLNRPKNFQEFPDLLELQKN